MLKPDENMSDMDDVPIQNDAAAALSQLIAKALTFDFVACMRRPTEVNYRSGWRTLPIDILTHHQGGASELRLRDGRVLHSEDGEGFCIPANVEHESVSVANARGISCWTSGVFRLWGTVSFLSLFETPCILNREAAGLVGGLTMELRRIAQGQDSISRSLGIRAIGNALASVIASGIPASPQMGLFLAGAHRLRPALEHIGANIAHVTIEQLAGILCLSPRRFHALFSATMSQSPGRYLQMLRMQRARHLLISSGMNVQEIGLQCGYADPYHFSRQFRACFGMCPSAYRAHPGIRTYVG